MHSERLGFKAQVADCRSRYRIYVIFLVIFRQVLESCLKIGHDRFLQMHCLQINMSVTSIDVGGFCPRQPMLIVGK